MGKGQPKFEPGFIGDMGHFTTLLSKPNQRKMFPTPFLMQTGLKWTLKDRVEKTGNEWSKG